jgi:hypothetical protein
VEAKSETKLIAQEKPSWENNICDDFIYIKSGLPSWDKCPSEKYIVAIT